MIVIVHVTHHAKGGVVNDLVKKLFASLTGGMPLRLEIKRILVLDSIFKKQYTV